MVLPDASLGLDAGPGAAGPGHDSGIRQAILRYL